MPLSMMEVGSKHRICAISGNDSVRKHLGDLGFTEGAEVTIIAAVDGNLVLGIHQSRVAINRDLAMRILV
ncbi:MAG: ferrous iron transport protein A [Kiritimatiellae bacterium]|nr:ferrous iron transport protein A [Kiritimatiellia bacterium]